MPSPASLAVIMGVSGSGKTTFGRALAARLEWDFLDADDFHPAANREKMHAGISLSDLERQPWLEALNAELRARHARGSAAVLACSALKRTYRAALRAGLADDLRFVFLEVDADTVRERVRGRGADHFFPESLVLSQFAALEPPTAGEAGSDPAALLILDATHPLEANLPRAAEFLLFPPGGGPGQRLSP